MKKASSYSGLIQADNKFYLNYHVLSPLKCFEIIPKHIDLFCRDDVKERMAQISELQYKENYAKHAQVYIHDVSFSQGNIYASYMSEASCKLLPYCCQESYIDVSTKSTRLKLNSQETQLFTCILDDPTLHLNTCGFRIHSDTYTYIENIDSNQNST